MVSESTRRAVLTLVNGVQTLYPIHFDLDDDSQVPWFFAAAALARATNLLSGIFVLTDSDDWPTARVLGRSLKEAWLYASYLALAGEEAVDDLLAEDQRHGWLLEHGRIKFSELVGELAGGGRLDLSTGFVQTSESRRPDLGRIARRVD